MLTDDVRVSAGKVGFLALLTLTLITGCMKEAPLSELKRTPFVNVPGWTVAENAEHGITVGVPSGWAVGSADAFGMSDFMPSGGDTGGEGTDVAKFQEQFAAEAEKMAAEESKALEKKGIYISVIDKSSRPIPGEERTRFEVRKKAMGGNATMDEAIALAKEQMLREGEPTPVDLPIGKATMFKSKNTLRDGGELTEIRYVLVDGKSIYTVVFMTQNPASTIEGIAPDVMKTLRIGKQT